MEQIACDHDHIHVLCSAHPKYAPGQLVCVIKSITARELFERFPKLRKELPGWGVLGRWVLRSDGWEARELGYCRVMYQEVSGQISERAVKALVALHALW